MNPTPNKPTQEEKWCSCEHAAGVVFCTSCYKPIRPTTSQENSLEHLRKDTKYDMPAVLEAAEKAGKVIRKHEDEDRTAQHWQGLAKGAGVGENWEEDYYREYGALITHPLANGLKSFIRKATATAQAQAYKEARATESDLMAQAIEVSKQGWIAQGRAEVREKREQLAELEHEQWIIWSKNLVEKETGLSPERVIRWSALWKPYSELTEAEKDQDREWADKTLRLLEEDKND